jgi:hypothetical protein
MTSSRGNRRVFYWEEGWLGWEHKHKRCSSRNLGGKGALSNIKFLFDLRSLRAWVCVRVTAEERAAESNRVRGGREHPGRHPRPGDKGANAWR